jgi:hypothetical protein
MTIILTCTGLFDFVRLLPQYAFVVVSVQTASGRRPVAHSSVLDFQGIRENALIPTDARDLCDVPAPVRP